MLRIGITQRCDKIKDRDEIRDALDVKWASFLWEIEMIAIPLSSEITDYDTYFEVLDLDGFILSGGNNITQCPKRDLLESAALNFSKKNNLPLMGVCRGMQYINYFLGGELEQVTNHVAVRHKLEGLLETTYPNLSVNSFHDFGITFKSINESLDILAHVKGVVEAFRHSTFYWMGIMWHPEREKPFSKIDHEIFKQFFNKQRKEQ